MTFTWLIKRIPSEDRELVLAEVAAIPCPTRRKINQRRAIWQARWYYGGDVIDGWIEAEYSRSGSRLTDCVYTRKEATV